MTFLDTSARTTLDSPPPVPVQDAEIERLKADALRLENELLSLRLAIAMLIGVKQ
jgi:hypothetical protein